jgi:molybdenum cofactor synthesis domain-containing protein
MDGYAVIAADTAGATNIRPRALQVIDRVYAGHMSRAIIEPGLCAEIATGGPLPPGADAVVMVEDTVRTDDGGTIQFLASVTVGQNVSPRGTDITSGSPVVRAGELLTPSRVGALAAIGAADAKVYDKPRVAVLSTGNEIVEPGNALAPGQIYDVNRFTLGAVVAAHGGRAEFHHSASDTLESLAQALDRSADADLIVFSGGSSVGERDFIVDLIHARGEIVFHGIAIKPGKPTAFARVSGAAFFGMPGNPTSCLSNAYVLLVPFLRATARLPAYIPHTMRAPLARAIRSTAGRHQFYTVRLEGSAVVPAFKGSGDITSLSRADGYIEIPADIAEVEQGAIVEVTLFQ